MVGRGAAAGGLRELRLALRSRACFGDFDKTAASCMSNGACAPEHEAHTAPRRRKNKGPGDVVDIEACRVNQVDCRLIAGAPRSVRTLMTHPRAP
jgi:hypothetical protein